jgi:hypothetical protein
MLRCSIGNRNGCFSQAADKKPPEELNKFSGSLFFVDFFAEKKCIPAWGSSTLKSWEGK